MQRNIGVTAQDATLDEVLTGRQNLVMIGRLSGLRRGRGATRGRPSCSSGSTSPTPPTAMLKGYSGGMRRRLDLAAGLVTRPPVLFLDEPTTGLDPTSRVRMWDVIRELVADGATLLLTTQYLDEADELADRIVVIDHGRAIADGTAAELKAQTGGARLEVTLTEADPDAAATRSRRSSTARCTSATTAAACARRCAAAPGSRPSVVRALDEAGDHRRRRRGPPALARRRVLRPDRPSDRRADRRRRLRTELDSDLEVTADDRTTHRSRRRRRAPASPADVRDVAVLTGRNLVHIAREPLQLSDVTDPAGAVHAAVRVRVRRRRRAARRRQLHGLRDRRPARAQPDDLGDGHGGRAQRPTSRTGVIDRFRTLPMWRPAVLVGRSRRRPADAPRSAPRSSP